VSCRESCTTTDLIVEADEVSGDMTSLDDAFLEAIVAEPDDDTPRLVYADWLEDHGQGARAEFIRIQIELSRLTQHEPRRQELVAREQALLVEHGEEWEGPLPRIATEWTFERGFLAGVKMPAKGFSQLPAVLTWSPTVRHLHLAGPFKNVKPSMRTIASSPYLARLTSLVISDGYYGIGGPAVVTLAGSEHVGGLTSLSLHNNAMGDAALVAIAGSPHLSRLTTLSLSCYGFNESDYIRAEGVRALVSSRSLARMTTLRLVRCGLTDEACEVLTESSWPEGLRTLDLRNNDLSPMIKQRLRARFGERVSFSLAASCLLRMVCLHSLPVNKSTTKHPRTGEANAYRTNLGSERETASHVPPHAIRDCHRRALRTCEAAPLAVSRSLSVPRAPPPIAQTLLRRVAKRTDLPRLR
jgi:uncharacterized protein (TIGR02996 family)